MSEQNNNFENGGEEISEEKTQIAENVEVKREKRKISLSTFICSAVAILVAAVMLTYTVCSSFYKKAIAEAKIEGAQNVTVNSVGKYDALEALEWFFKTRSFEEIDDEEQLTAVLKAYVAATGDKYAEFFTQEEYEVQMDGIAGESVGIGVSVLNDYVEINGVEYNTIKILKIFKGSPASASELKIGDRIAWIGLGDDAEYVGSIGYTAAVNKLRGVAETEAEFVVIRQDENGDFITKEIKITRAKYEVESVEGKKLDGTNIGLVRIDSFDITTPKQLSEVMDSLISQGCEKFVFDLRNNPGGELTSIVSTLSFFLEKGDTVISTETVNGVKETHKVRAIKYSDEYEPCSVSESDIGKYAEYEKAVICNGDTASAAELFTANFRDYKLGTVVGTTTYGKGVAQNFADLSFFGINGYLKYTSKLYYPPCGENYDGVGIVPDVVEELSNEAKKHSLYDLPTEKDNQLQKAIECLNK